MKPELPRETADPARLLQLPAERELPGSRHRLLKEYLMQEFAQQQADQWQTEERRAEKTGARLSRRPRRLLAGAVASIAAAAGVAVFVVGGGSAGAGGSVAVGGTAAATATVTATSTSTSTQAARELGRIATVADSKPVQTVRDNQFVYVESKVAWEQDTKDSSGYHSTLQPLHLRQIWQSVDGSQDGLLRESGQDTTLPAKQATTDSEKAAGSRNGNGPILDDASPSITNPDYRYLQSLPTDPAKLLKLIYAETKGEGSSADSEAFAAIGDALIEQIAPPAVTAALYQAAAMIPGVYVVDDVVDATGRHDVAVALQNGVAANEWLFDKSNLDYVGEQSVALKAGPLGPAGTIEGTQVILYRAIVDRVGQIPTGSAS